MKRGITNVSGMVIGLVGIVLAAGPVAAARRGSPMGPPAVQGVWHPVVGSGAVYEMQEGKQPAVTWEVAVVGQEAGGYWVETRMTTPEEMSSKSLMVGGAVKRMIVKTPGEPAMELPAMAMGPGTQTDVDERGTLIGTERISTPAGAFDCQHYRVETDGDVSDAWVNTAISPYGLVKMSGPGMTLVLTRVVTGVKTRITETPQTFSIPSF